MSQDIKHNPFAKLFPSVDAAIKYAEQCESKVEKQLEETKMEVDIEPTIPTQFQNVNEKIEKIFGISLNKNTKNQVVYLSDVATSNQIWIDLETLEQVLFERLLIEEPSLLLLNKSQQPSREFVVEKEVLTYLFQCYQNIFSIIDAQPNFENTVLFSMVNQILRNVSTALKQPELYSGQDLAAQLVEIFGGTTYQNCLQYRVRFLNNLVKEMIKDEEDATSMIQQAFLPLLRHLHRQIAIASLSSFPREQTFGCLDVLACDKLTADALITYSTPAVMSPGNVFANTLIGAVLCLSCLPKINEGEYQYFKKGDSGSQYEGAVWTSIAEVNECLYNLMFQLLKISPEVKEKTISWISSCLQSNEARGKLWSTHGLDPAAELASSSVSDAFMINLGAVLLRLCGPIVSDLKERKYFKIDPTYGAEAFKKDTCLISAESPESRPKAKSFNFVTKIFFLTHKAIDLGFRVGVERLLRLNQDLQRLLEINRNNTGMANSFLRDAFMTRTEMDTTKFLTLKSALLEPKAQDLLVDLHVATCKWIVQVLLDVEPGPRNDYQIVLEKRLTFPLPEEIAPTLACIPEFLIENLNCFLPFSKRYNASKLEERGIEILEPMVTLIVVLTRGNRRMKNPHLRAGLIESLEGLLPNEDISTFWRTQLFQQHPHGKEIIPSLLDVFVSIEMTGESVQFDQKFKYRRPIYVLMEFLWKNKVYKECFKKLAFEAEKNMEAVTPPIFLRFLNLLINDAVYLLDEALSNMAQLKTMQLARESRDNHGTSTREQEQSDALFQQTGMIARFDNILGKWTIRTLQFITTEIKNIFVHPTMVDRVAAMLNYFLHNLVGPNQKNLKVKDQEEYEFRPGELVLAICHIYANLADSDAFCLAISQDGRSYNSKLFLQAEEVLYRINGSMLVPEIRAVAARVAKMDSLQKRQEELMADAPEDFLDPIMSTIMTDPVVLPTSHVTVDRSTIARHLLSDQTDPFNRAPMTMDMVQPNEELRSRIRAWMEERTRSGEPSGSKDS